MKTQNKNYSVIVTQYFFRLLKGRDFPGGLLIKNPCSQCRGHGFSPGRRTKILHGMAKNKKLCFSESIEMAMPGNADHISFQP